MGASLSMSLRTRAQAERYHTQFFHHSGKAKAKTDHKAHAALCLMILMTSASHSRLQSETQTLDDRISEPYEFESKAGLAYPGGRQRGRSPRRKRYQFCGWKNA